MNINITLRDKERIEKYKILFGIISRVFYESIDVAILDSVVHLFFKQFYFETSQILEMTQIPEKKLRQSLIKLDKAKIIKKITDYHMDFQRSFLREVIDTNWTKDQ